VAGYRHRVTVDHEAPQPVYQQIAAILRAQIEAGELVPDRPIPSESTLMQRYGVARETARKAVRVLVAEGLVYVVQGRGAYVARRGYSLVLRRASKHFAVGMLGDAGA
jgi:DNA-binding GntR family transcriptional regulator